MRAVNQIRKPLLLSPFAVHPPGSLPRPLYRFRPVSSDREELLQASARCLCHLVNAFSLLLGVVRERAMQPQSGRWSSGEQVGPEGQAHSQLFVQLALGVHESEQKALELL